MRESNIRELEIHTLGGGAFFDGGGRVERLKEAV